MKNFLLLCLISLFFSCTTGSYLEDDVYYNPRENVSSWSIYIVSYNPFFNPYHNPYYNPYYNLYYSPYYTFNHHYINNYSNIQYGPRKSGMGGTKIPQTTHQRTKRTKAPTTYQRTKAAPQIKQSPTHQRTNKGTSYQRTKAPSYQRTQRTKAPSYQRTKAPSTQKSYKPKR